ncbi:MAG: NifB/NifX family molybdenum-iron cluster-binding protein [Candidatus Diapherotrites archaeon]|nr:NifB/NifX family molybdenum-iron cluster-binding protein [Candidatus Diapherotrites archaeon]
MKVAVSSLGRELQSNVSLVFGRCPFFIIAEIEGDKIIKSEAIENSSMNQATGAGISAAERVANLGVKAIITGNIGPRAAAVFQQLGIEVYKGSGTVEETLKNFIEGKLERML